MAYEWEPFNLLPQFGLLVHEPVQHGPYRGEPLPRETPLYGWIIWVLCHPWTMTPNAPLQRRAQPVRLNDSWAPTNRSEKMETKRMTDWLDAHGTLEAHAIRDALRRTLAENARLKRKVNAILDAIQENAPRATAKRIIGAVSVRPNAELSGAGRE